MTYLEAEFSFFQFSQYFSSHINSNQMWLINLYVFSKHLIGQIKLTSMHSEFDPLRIIFLTEKTDFATCKEKIEIILPEKNWTRVYNINNQIYLTGLYLEKFVIGGPVITCP